uniref:Uncharacterized protein n=1 Tax=viral metagenome TaxID=1070528 RepID=A0A6C0I5X0_9ZZZZ
MQNGLDKTPRPDILRDSINAPITIIDNTSSLWGTMLSLQDNLNLRIGTMIWKKYINAAFWNYISTPINFTITLFTAMSAGQTGTQSNYLSQNQLFYILFVSFILSIINTFFKLKDKAIMNYDSLKKYQDFGAEFEKIYFTNICNEEGVHRRYYSYLELQSKLNTFESTGSIEQVNYVTELIYLSIKCCFADRMKRISMKERFWVLDGRPKQNYSHNFYVNLRKQYHHNFDIEEGKEEEEEKENKERREIIDVSGNHVSSSCFCCCYHSRKKDKSRSRASRVVYRNTWPAEEEGTKGPAFHSLLVKRLTAFTEKDITEDKLVAYLAKDSYTESLTSDMIQECLEHLGTVKDRAKRLSIILIDRVNDTHATKRFKENIFMELFSADEEHKLSADEYKKKTLEMNSKYSVFREAAALAQAKLLAAKKDEVM